MLVYNENRGGGSDADTRGVEYVGLGRGMLHAGVDSGNSYGELK